MARTRRDRVPLDIHPLTPERWPDRYDVTMSVREIAQHTVP